MTDERPTKRPTDEPVSGEEAQAETTQESENAPPAEIEPVEAAEVPERPLEEPHAAQPDAPGEQHEPEEAEPTAPEQPEPEPTAPEQPEPEPTAPEQPEPEPTAPEQPEPEQPEPEQPEPEPTDVASEAVPSEETEPNAPLMPDEQEPSVPASDEPAASAAAPTPPAQAEPSLGARCFFGLSHVGWLVLLLFSGAATVLNLVTHKLPLPADAHWNSVLQALRESGNWLFFTSADGALFTDLPPLYIWFLAGLERVPLLWDAVPQPLLPQVATALSLVLCVLSTWLLARGTGHTPRVALAAGCMLLISLTLAGFGLCAGPGLLFASLLMLSLLCLYRGWVASSAPLALLAGFMLAAAAALTRSPLGLALPLLASLVFLFWRGTFRRAGQRDGAFGFAVMLVLTVGWITWLAITPAAKPYLTAVLQQWRVRDVATVMTSWCLPFAVLVFMACPWPLLLPALPWERLYRVPVLFWQNRHNAPGSGWIWWCLLAGLALLPFMAGSPVTSALPLLPLLAIVGGKAIMELTPGRSCLFLSLLALLLLVLAAVTGTAALLPRVATWIPADLLTSVEAYLASLPCEGSRLVPLMPFLSAVQGLGVVAGVSFAGSLWLFRITDKRHPAGGLLLFTVVMLLLVQPVLYLTLPSLLAYFGV